MANNLEDTHLDKFRVLFSSVVFQKGTAPLRKGVEIGIYLDDKGPITLKKEEDSLAVLSAAPKNPDLSIWVTLPALEYLANHSTEDVGEMGVEILKLMAHKDPTLKMRVKLHIGIFNILRNGYLNILPLGGGTVMKFLASKGLTNISKIKDALSSLRG